MPEGEQNPGAPASGSPPQARPTGDAAVSLALASHHRNPVKIAKVMQREIDRLTSELARAGTPAGAIVLTGDDAKAWESYRALGKPDALQSIVAERDTLQQAATARTEQEAREALFVEGASAFGWNEGAARKAARALAGMKLERREDEFDVTANGQTTKVKKSVPYVITGEGPTAKAERLDAVIANEHDLYLPALTAAQPTTTPTTPAPASRFPVTPAAPANGGAGTSEKERAAELRASGHYAF